MYEGYAAIHRGWGSLMTHSAGSVTTKSISLKCVMAYEQYMYTWYLKQIIAGSPYIDLLCTRKTLLPLKVKCFRTWFFFQIQDKILGRYAKNWISPKYYFAVMCKVGLRTTIEGSDEREMGGGGDAKCSMLCSYCSDGYLLFFNFASILENTCCRFRSLKASFNQIGEVLFLFILVQM